MNQAYSENIYIIHKIENKYFNDLHELFQKTYWTTERQFSEFKNMIANTSFLSAAIDKKKDKLVGITRVFTDFTYIALICDVMVLPEYQKLNIGKQLLDNVCNTPKLKDVKQLELYCKDDMIPFYEKWGFVKSDSLNFMRKIHR